MKKSRTYKLEIIVAIFLVLVGIVTLILPFLGVYNCRLVLNITFGVISLISLLWFLKNPKSKDKESFLTFISTLIIFILSLILKPNPANLALILLLYVMLLSLIRLKKADYYHDHKNIVWKINITTLVLFIVTGLLTSINLYYNGSIQILMFGYFFLINGILELIDPLVLYLKR